MKLYRKETRKVPDYDQNYYPIVAEHTVYVRAEDAERKVRLAEAEILAAKHFGYTATDLAAHAEATPNVERKAILARCAKALRAIEEAGDD